MEISVFTPRWVEGLQISLDWYDIEITEAIAFTEPQTILDRCVDNPGGINNQFCGQVTRDSIGNIAELGTFPLNLNSFETSGLDFEVDYQLDLGNFGTLHNRLIAAYLDERTETLSSADDIDIVKGELGDPEWQLNYRGTLLFDNWEVFAEARWIDDQFIEEQELLFGSGTNNDPNPDVTDNFVADSAVYVDLGASYRFDNGLTLGATIDNVFDEDPPFALFGNGESTTSGGSAIFDNVGRFFMVQASWDFGGT